MSLAARFHKIRFLVEEMQLALCLAKHAPDDFTARMLARHILIRANDLITHTRALKKPLNLAGFKTREFHKSKEIYANTFDEYFQIARDKLGAHIQDFDFGKRIDLWNSIESVKIDYFVDGARELYDGLKTLRIPDYQSYTESAELFDVDLITVLNSIKTSLVGKQFAEVGTDPLAMTRPNTTAIINLSPVHSRAGQLSLIRRWIKIQTDLLELLTNYQGVRRILKARLITDIVSFCDCLVTRPVLVNSPQEMEGLDKLIVSSGQSASAISDFLKVSHFARDLQTIRAVRDVIGAHLEIDPNVSLSRLLNDLNTLNLDICLQFFEMVKRAFEKICRNVLFLQTHAIDGANLKGIMSIASPSVIPFNDSEFPLADRNVPLKLDFNSKESYTANLERWLHGDAIAQEDARYYFFQAFMFAERKEEVVEIEKIGESGFRRTLHELRKSHQFIIDTLKAETDARVIDKIFQLLLACRSGAPYMLAEVILRYAQSNIGKYDIWICYGLGEIASFPHDGVERLLINYAKQTDNWNTRFHATLALFKIFVSSEGLLRINRRVSNRSYKDVILPLTKLMTNIQRLLCTISFASQFVSVRLRTFAEPFKQEYHYLQAEIVSICKGSEFTDICIPVEDKITKFVETHDYVGLCVVISDQLTHVNKTALAKEFLTVVCTGAVAAASHDDAIRNLAVCFLRNGEFPIALQFAEGLAERNPDRIERQIFVAEVLAATPDSKHLAHEKIKMIKANYILGQEHQNALLALELHLASLDQL